MGHCLFMRVRLGSCCRASVRFLLGTRYRMSVGVVAF